MFDLACLGTASAGPIVDWFRSRPPGDPLRAALSAVVAYVLGCLATGYYLVRIRTGKDVRTMESGNIGARNVGRVLGAPGFFVTLLGDAAKGALAVLIARLLSLNDPLVTGAAIPAALAGHLWPAQLGFRGGKGVSTGLGAVLAFDCRLAIPLAAAAALGYLLARKSVPAGMFMFACLPPASWWIRHDVRIVGLLSVAVVMIIAAHRKNLARDLGAGGTRRDGTPPGAAPPT